MRRQHLLATAALLLLVLLAGCEAAGSVEMDPVTDDELVDRASRSLERTAPGTEPDREATMLRSALANGSGTIDATAPPVRAGLPFEHDGAYYDLSWTVVDERTETSVAIEIDYNATDPSGERIDYADLPAPDRRALAALLPRRHERETEGYDFGAATRYDDTAVAASVLVPEQRYDVVVYGGEAYPIRVGGTREVTVNTYRYTSRRVAGDADEYAAALKEEHLFALSGLSEAERSVVDAAIEDDYYAEDEDDEAFRSLLDRLRRHEPVAGEEAHGEWLVRYEGEVYWTDVWYDGFVG